MLQGKKEWLSKQNRKSRSLLSKWVANGQRSQTPFPNQLVSPGSIYPLNGSNSSTSYSKIYFAEQQIYPQCHIWHIISKNTLVILEGFNFLLYRFIHSWVLSFSDNGKKRWGEKGREEVGFKRDSDFLYMYFIAFFPVCEVNPYTSAVLWFWSLVYYADSIRYSYAL